MDILFAREGQPGEVFPEGILWIDFLEFAPDAVGFIDITKMTSDPTFTVRSPRQVGLLMSAQALADHLARKTFRHTCDHGTCGDWMFWPVPDNGPTHD